MKKKKRTTGRDNSKKREKQTTKPKKVAFMILYLISSNGLFNTKYLMTYIPLTTLGA